MGRRSIVARAPEARWAASAAARSTSKRTSPLTRRSASAPARWRRASRSAPPVPAITGSRETASGSPAARAPASAAAAIASGRWWTFTTARETPAPARSPSVQETSGTPQSGTAGFGTRAVSGRSRVPSPAQRTMATVSATRRLLDLRPRPRLRRACYTPAVPSSPTARLRALYFLYYGNVGTYLPFFAVYLKGLGFTGQQIGVI